MKVKGQIYDLYMDYLYTQPRLENVKGDPSTIRSTKLQKVRSITERYDNVWTEKWHY